MNEAERRELKDALVKAITKLVLMALVVFGAVDLAVVAPLLREAASGAVYSAMPVSCGVLQ